MATAETEIETVPELNITAEPPQVDAGGDVTVRIAVPADVGGLTLLIRDHEGNTVASTDNLSGSEPGQAELTVAVPVALGDYTWSAEVHETGALDDDPLLAAGTFSLTVTPHTVSIVVWDVPPVVVAGERFTIKIGLKCSSTCRSEGWRFEIADETGAPVTGGAVGGEPWPGTTSLFFKEIAVVAPATPGSYDWTVTVPTDDYELAHAARKKILRLRVEQAPEHLVTVEAFDKTAQTPVQGMKVTAHPYRAFTDSRGVAQLRLPPGRYPIFVSGRKYFPFRSETEVEGDMVIRAELIVDEGPTIQDIWA